MIAAHKNLCVTRGVESVVRNEVRDYFRAQLDCCDVSAYVYFDEPRGGGFVIGLDVFLCNGVQLDAEINVHSDEKFKVSDVQIRAAVREKLRVMTNFNMDK